MDPTVVTTGDSAGAIIAKVGWPDIRRSAASFLGLAIADEVPSEDFTDVWSTRWSDDLVIHSQQIVHKYFGPCRLSVLMFSCLYHVVWLVIWWRWTSTCWESLRVNNESSVRARGLVLAAHPTGCISGEPCTALWDLLEATGTAASCDFSWRS